MVRKLEPSMGIQVYSPGGEVLAQSSEGVAEEIWNSLPQPSLQAAIEELKSRELDVELHKATLVVLVRKSTEHRLKKTRGARFDASKVVRGLNEAIEANRPDWEERVAS